MVTGHAIGRRCILASLSTAQVETPRLGYCASSVTAMEAQAPRHNLADTHGHRDWHGHGRI